MKTFAVIGKNFGDEGKGLVTASLCSKPGKSLVVKCNGGAQAGHTVENIHTGARFVHHQIGSGAEYGSATLLANTFHPDLYQLGNELATFKRQFGFEPALYAEPGAVFTTIDDVLLNMAIETKRGNARHGSCGMGINECCERIQNGYGITLAELSSFSLREFIDRLALIRREYTKVRAEELEVETVKDYMDLLSDDDVLGNYAEEAIRNLHRIILLSIDFDWLDRFDRVVFENGQGLLLDRDHVCYAPHLTSSKTGIEEVLAFLNKRGARLDEAIYVTRSYVTRHGMGPLPFECGIEELPGVKPDRTNQTNPWQGHFRYARHGLAKDFLTPVLNDLKNTGMYPSIAITHLNETNRRICFVDEKPTFEEFARRIAPDVCKVYGSWDAQYLHLQIGNGMSA